MEGQKERKTGKCTITRSWHEDDEDEAFPPLLGPLTLVQCSLLLLHSGFEEPGH